MSEAQPEAVPVQGDLPGAPASEPTPTPTPVPAAPSSWRDGLSEDVRSHPSIKNFLDVGQLAESYVSQSELVGRKGVILPTEGDAADQARFYGELGRPETAGDYDLGDFVPPNEIAWSENVQTTVLDAMHNAGLTNAQVNDVVRAYSESQQTEFEGVVQGVTLKHEEGITDLKREYGANYDAKVDSANRAFDLAAGDKKDEIRLMVMADGSTLGNNPAMIRMFVKMGESIGEDKLRGGGGVSSFTKSPDQAKAELSALAIDETYEKVLWDKNHPEHDRAVQRKADLYTMAYPDAVTTE